MPFSFCCHLSHEAGEDRHVHPPDAFILGAKLWAELQRSKTRTSTVAELSESMTSGVCCPLLQGCCVVPRVDLKPLQPHEVAAIPLEMQAPGQGAACCGRRMGLRSTGAAGGKACSVPTMGQSPGLALLPPRLP